MTQFERIKGFDKAGMMDFLVCIADHCGLGTCAACPLECVKESCTQANMLRWLESEVEG